MRVLLCNKFYYPRGGDCIAVIALEALLKCKGHEVAIFSSAHKNNLPSKWSKYFPSEISFSGGGLRSKFKAFKRLFYSREVKRKFTALLDDFNPDIVHINNIHSYLSPSIVRIAAQRNIKVVWTVHDYKLVCPTYKLLRNNKICHDCYKCKAAVFTSKCMKNSYVASFLAYLEILFWNRRKLEHCTTSFVCPSHFMKQTMIDGGYDASKLNVIHNFLPNTSNLISEDHTSTSNYYCFVGRLSEEKGVDILIDSAKKIDKELVIIGDGPEMASLVARADGASNIQFVGFKSWPEMVPIISQARFTVVPSVWHEVFGLTVIESMLLGRPVLGARCGGIPELIQEGVNGMTFERGNKDQLKQKIEEMFNYQFNSSYISSRAKERFSADNYYYQLIRIYYQ